MELLKKYCHFPIQRSTSFRPESRIRIFSPQGRASTLTATLPRIVTAEYFPTAGFTISQFRRGRPSGTGFFGGVFFDREKYPSLNQALDRIAETHNSTPTAIATAWLLRHPADLQVLSGTMKPERLTEMCQATEITLTRDEWYVLLNEGLKLFPGGTK